MKKPIQIKMILTFLTLGAGTGILYADERLLWRSWGVRDGLTETYSRAVSVTPGGSSYIRHGAVLSMSLFDGYGITRISEPRGNAQPYWPSTKRAYSLPGGTLWTSSLDALLEFRNGKWMVRYTAPAGLHVLAAVPGGRHVMVLMEDGLREFDPEHQSWRIIRIAENSRRWVFTSLR
jgi:hypothetical protein